MPMSAFADPSPGSSTTSGRRPPRAGVKKPVARPSANAIPARKPMLRWPVASTAARAPMIANLAASETSINVRRS
jgi:hypothetical protein